jgi:hypothetical protein
MGRDNSGTENLVRPEVLRICRDTAALALGHLESGDVDRAREVLREFLERAK